MSQLQENMSKSLAEIRKPNELIRAVDLPVELAQALASGRSELALMVKPRALAEIEMVAVFKAFATLMETNLALQRHSQICADIADNITQSFKNTARQTQSLIDFASYREHVEDEEL